MFLNNAISIVCFDVISLILQKLVISLFWLHVLRRAWVDVAKYNLLQVRFRIINFMFMSSFIQILPWNLFKSFENWMHMIRSSLMRELLSNLPMLYIFLCHHLILSTTSSLLLLVLKTSFSCIFCSSHFVR